MDANIVIDGFILREGFNKLKKKIYDMEVFDSDIWICTFPKSGTTWTQETCWLLTNNLDYKEAKKTSLMVRSPNLELSMFEGHVWENIKHFFNGEEDIVSFTKNMKGNRIIKTHLPWNFLPKQIQSGERKPKIIYVTRDPRDVIVSAYYFYLNAERQKYTFEQFFGAFIADMVPFAPYWEHVFSYYNNKHKPNLRFLQYEKMKENLEREIKGLIKYLDLNVQLTDGQMKELLQHLSFDSMKKNVSTNYDNIYDKFRKEQLCNESFVFIRSGKVGDHKNHMTPEMNALTNKWIKENFEKRGMSYDEVPVHCSVD